MTLLSVVLTLQVQKESFCVGPSGRDAQAWFLGHIETCQPDLARRLHDSPELRPYTLSSLYTSAWRPLAERQAIPVGQAVYLRLTALTEEVATCIRSISTGKAISLQRIPLVVQQIAWNESQHLWAGEQSYGGLIQQTTGTSARQVEFQFATPTAFRVESSDIPLPIPDLILRSWWRKWNSFAPPELRIDDVWPRFAEACVRVGKLRNINTMRWSFADGARGAATGFYGDVGLNLLPPQACRDWVEYWPGAAQVLQTLGAFSLYCGTGHHTTVGLGQTLPLPRSA